VYQDIFTALAAVLEKRHSSLGSRSNENRSHTSDCLFTLIAQGAFFAIWLEHTSSRIKRHLYSISVWLRALAYRQRLIGRIV